MKIFAVITSLMITTCAYPQSHPKVVIESDPKPITLETEKFEEPTAGEYLDMAFKQYMAGLWRYAADSFTLALKTGELNDKGRALAYWHIGECYIKLQDRDKCAEAWFSFITIAQDLIEYNAKDEFVVGFQLERKIKLAGAFIKALWKERTSEPNTGESSTRSSGSERR